MVRGPSLRGLARLRAQVAETLGVEDPELPAVLGSLVEATPADWEQRFGTRPRVAVQVSALMAMGGVPGLVRPHLLDVFHETAAYQSLVHELAARFPRRAVELEAVLRRLVELVPRPVDLSETRRVLELCFEGRMPSSIGSLLELLGAPAPVVVGGEPIDPVDAARRLRERLDPGFALTLLEAGLLPAPVAEWMRQRQARQGERAAVVPLRVLAGLPAEAGALLVCCAPPHPPQWASTLKTVSHISRLARVIGLGDPPSCWPAAHLLGRLNFGPAEAHDYETALAADVEALAEELVEADELDEAEASARATKRLMAGFWPFVDYLEAARARGAPITELPRGLPVEHSSVRRYQGMCHNLCPPPEVALRLLAMAPGLLEAEEDGRLVLLQLLSGARASVVLALRRRWVVEVDEGLLFFVPAAANKTGRTLLFVPSALVDAYGVSPEWLPEEAPLDPPQWRRDELAGAIERLCHNFERETGVAVVHSSVRFTRSMLAQLYRPYLTGVEREAITALLGHKKRETRANYLRCWPEEDEAANRAWWLGNG